LGTVIPEEDNRPGTAEQEGGSERIEEAMDTFIHQTIRYKYNSRKL
jgi:hypothetical protein